MKKLIIAGGTGFIGEALINQFKEDYDIIVLSRKHIIDTDDVKYLKWDGNTIFADISLFENAEAFINLCGKNVNCRYTERNKQEIYDSRIKSCLALGKLINQLEVPPKVWLNTVSSTIYRHSLDRPNTESHYEIGQGFSVDVCHKWEGTINNIETPKTRKVLLRTSIVLGKNGGAMRPLLTAVKLGLGGKQGNGKQMISWIHEGDLARMVQFIMEETELTGEFNAASPHPVMNKEFMKQLRSQWKIPFGIPAPKWALKVAKQIIGIDPELALKSRYVLPEKVMDAGFEFQYNTLKEAFVEIKTRVNKPVNIPEWG